jgi:hypothetical protein
MCHPSPLGPWAHCFPGFLVFFFPGFWAPGFLGPPWVPGFIVPLGSWVPWASLFINLERYKNPPPPKEPLTNTNNSHKTRGGDANISHKIEAVARTVPIKLEVGP